jgi:hypothetical protein
LAEIEQSAKLVRKRGVDLVLVAVPIDQTPTRTEKSIRSFSWIMNWSLNFGPPTWDCLVVAPSVAHTQLTEQQAERAQLVRQLVRAQDLSLVDRAPGDDRSPETLLADWFRKQVIAAKSIGQ